MHGKLHEISHVNLKKEFFDAQRCLELNNIGNLKSHVNGITNEANNLAVPCTTCWSIKIDQISLALAFLIRIFVDTSDTRRK